MNNQPNIPPKNDKKPSAASIVGAGILIVILASISAFILSGANSNCRDESSYCPDLIIVPIIFVGAPVAIAAVIIAVYNFYK
ncbi:hypothetical protein IJM16_00080 [Candidatus Saccharibacteria bacterium]|nr:hypothetical protein [Candidatus Saccharibacteria bacterium]